MHNVGDWPAEAEVMGWGWFPPPPRLFTNFLGIFFLSFSDALLDSCRGSFCTYLDVLCAVFAVTVN